MKAHHTWQILPARGGTQGKSGEGMTGDGHCTGKMEFAKVGAEK